jgi:hypothetical protein
MNFPFPEEFEEFSHQKAFTRCFISDVTPVLAGISSRREPPSKPTNFADAFQTNWRIADRGYVDF